MKTETRNQIREIVYEMMKGKVENFIENIFMDNECRDEVIKTLPDYLTDDENVMNCLYEGEDGIMEDGVELTEKLTESLTDSFMCRFE